MMKTTPALLAAALASLALAGASATPDASAAAATEAVVALDLEPPCLNVLLGGCNFAVVESTAGPALAGAFRVRPDSTYEPVLVERVDVEREPFALTYRIADDAIWSDGTPVSADDFLFTLETILDPRNTIARRGGYDLVTAAAKLGPKTVRLQFSRGYAAWRSLFPHVLPKHVLAGHDFDTVWQDEIADPVTHAPIASGPFLVTSWIRGSSLTVSRNPRWWGPRGPILDSIRFRFVPDSNSQFNAIRAGEVDVITPQPQLQVAELRSAPGIAVQSLPGFVLEHLDANVGSTTMPLLRETWFRQALAHALDRDAAFTHAWGSLAPGYGAQQNLSFTGIQPGYVPSFARYGYDPAAVAAIMSEHGCDLGGDGIWSCAGVRASVKLATTVGNAVRLQVQEDFAAQARAAGIELLPDNSSGGELFGVRLPARQYELIMFAWVLSDTFPPLERYGCTGGSNHMGYCSAPVTDLLARAEAEVDPAERARLVNAADAILADDAPTIPLFVRPTFVAHRTALTGPQVNPAGAATWNAEEWYLGPADTIAPSLTAAASPSANAHGWNRGPVTIELAAVDGDGSGVHEIRHTLGGAQTGGAVTPGSRASVTVTAEGVTTIAYRARDRFGNTATGTLTIRIDRTAPDVTCSVDPDVLWPPDRTLVSVQAAVEVEDALSGPAGFTLVGVTGGDPDDVSGFRLGMPDVSGSLRAEWSPGERERLYTLVYEGADVADNTARCSVDVAVRRG